MRISYCPKCPAGPALAVAAGLLLAQLGAPSNLGVPAVPGTNTPESSPATTPVAPSAGVGTPQASTAGTAPAAPAATGGPAYSFGAAPAPVVSPGR
jgi:hypothetical protein